MKPDQKNLLKQAVKAKANGADSMLKSTARLEQNAQELAALHRTTSSSLYSGQKLRTDGFSKSLDTTAKASAKAAALLAQYSDFELVDLDELEDSCDDEPVSPSKILASSQPSALKLRNATKQTCNDMGDQDLDDLMMELSDGHLQRLQEHPSTSNARRDASLKRYPEELHRGPPKRIAIDLTSSSPATPSSGFRNSRSPSAGDRMVLLRRNGVMLSPSRISPSSSPMPRSKGPLFASPSLHKSSENGINTPPGGSSSSRRSNFSQTSSQTILGSSRSIHSSMLNPCFSGLDIPPADSVLKVSTAMNRDLEVQAPVEQDHRDEHGVISEPQSEDWDDIEKWMADSVDIVD